MRHALLLLVCLAPGCGESPSRAASLTTEIDTIADTVTVRTAGMPAADRTHRLVVEKSIGQAEGPEEYSFTAVADIAVGPRGEIYVWDGALVSLRLYDSAGAYIRTVSRKGQGPGEHLRSNGIALTRDGRLLLWDPGNARINVFTSAGDLAASWRVDPSPVRPRWLYTDTAGNAYMRRSWRNPPDTASRVGLVRIGPDGIVRDTLIPPAIGDPTPMLTAQSGGRISNYAIPYMPGALWAFSPLGYFVAGPGEPYVVHVHRRDGLPVRIQRELDRTPVDAGERAALNEQILSALRRTDPGYQWNGPDIPDLKPAYRGLSVGDDGRIWVTVSQPSEPVAPEEAPSGPPGGGGPLRTWREPTVYEVFEPSGQFLGRVAVPPRANVMRMRGNHAWGAVVDSLDIPYVTRFRIEPAFGAGRQPDK